MSAAVSQPKGVYSSTPVTGYLCLGILARGGMGQVELAVREQGTFRRLYAVKRLRAEHRDDTDFRKMFMDEARIAGMIRHPNVVSVLDVGEDERGPYLVMEFVEGITAARLISWAHKSGKSLSVQLAARIARDAAAGVAAAHGLQSADGKPIELVHRDISPQNILIGFDGVARVTDFGIAKALGRASQTTQGILKGKSGYMAPEQLRFERATQPSDFFSLGVVLFELLAGRRLYGGKDAILIAQRILTEPPPDIFSIREDAHPALVELLFDLLAKRPEQRPASADEIVRRLDALIDEIAADDGSERIDDYLAKHFAEKKAEQERVRQSATQTEAIAEMLDLKPLQAEEPGTGSVDIPEAVAAPITTVSGGAAGGDTLLRSIEGRKRRARWVMLTCAAIVVGGAGIAFVGNDAPASIVADKAEAVSDAPAAPVAMGEPEAEASEPAPPTGTATPAAMDEPEAVSRMRSDAARRRARRRRRAQQQAQRAKRGASRIVEEY